MKIEIGIGKEVQFQTIIFWKFYIRMNWITQAR